jgi:Ca2+-binding EF-hand superfamily protein
MIRVLGLTTLLAALALGLTTAGAGGGDDKDKKKFDPETTFKKLDTNGDGKLSKAEFLQIAEKIKEKAGEEKAAKAREFLGKVFDKLDTDNTGYLTLEQFKKFGELRKKLADKKKNDDK